MAKTDRAYLMLGWLIGRLVMGIRASSGGEDLPPEMPHVLGEAVVENEVAPECGKDGSYDSVTYCSLCGEEVARETNTVAALSHVSGSSVEENRVEATHLAEGGYDTVAYCTKCGEEMSRTHTVIPMRTLKGWTYNGTQLPELRTDTYPYMLWGYTYQEYEGYNSYRLIATSKPLSVGAVEWTAGYESGVDYNRLINANGAKINYSVWWKIMEGDQYYPSLYSSLKQTMDLYNGYVSAENIVWANYDIYRASGLNKDFVLTDELYFPKSPDPVPIYK